MALHLTLALGLSGRSVAVAVQRNADGLFLDFADGTFKVSPGTPLHAAPEGSALQAGVYAYTVPDATTLVTANWPDGKYLSWWYDSANSNALLAAPGSAEMVGGSDDAVSSGAGSGGGGGINQGQAQAACAAAISAASLPTAAQIDTALAGSHGSGGWGSSGGLTTDQVRAACAAAISGATAADIVGDLAARLAADHGAGSWTGSGGGGGGSGLTVYELAVLRGFVKVGGSTGSWFFMDVTDPTVPRVQFKPVAAPGGRQVILDPPAVA